MDKDDQEGTWTLADGTKLTLRHIAAGDASREQALVKELSVQSRYFRFHGAIRELNKKDLKNFTEPDSRNAVALIVLHDGEAGEEEIGVARYVIDPDRTNCEFAIVVADKWQQLGIGTKLMNALINHLQASGVNQITGSVLRSNSAMLKFIKEMGFTETNIPDDPSTVSITKHLDQKVFHTQPEEGDTRMSKVTNETKGIASAKQNGKGMPSASISEKTGTRRTFAPNQNPIPDPAHKKEDTLQSTETRVVRIVEGLTGAASERPQSYKDQIAELAYSFYQARGHMHGHDMADWLKAEAELSNEFNKH